MKRYSKRFMAEAERTTYCTYCRAQPQIPCFSVKRKMLAKPHADRLWLCETEKIRRENEAKKK